MIWNVDASGVCANRALHALNYPNIINSMTRRLLFFQLIQFCASFTSAHVTCCIRFNCRHAKTCLYDAIHTLDPRPRAGARNCQPQGTSRLAAGVAASVAPGPRAARVRHREHFRLRARMA